MLNSVQKRSKSGVMKIHFKKTSEITSSECLAIYERKQKRVDDRFLIIIFTCIQIHCFICKQNI